MRLRPRMGVVMMVIVGLLEGRSRNIPLYIYRRLVSLYKNVTVRCKVFGSGWLRGRNRGKTGEVNANSHFLEKWALGVEK
jgi:hypothetical protein